MRLSDIFKPDWQSLNDRAQSWSLASNIPIVYITKDVDKLEEYWVKYNSEVYKNRKRSDAASIEIYGLTNKERYDKMKAYLNHIEKDNEDEGLGDDVSSDNTPKHDYVAEPVPTITSISNDIEANNPKPVTEPEEPKTTEPDTMVSTTEAVNIKKANEFELASNINMIKHTSSLADLENEYDKYIIQPYDDRKKANAASMEIFGSTNDERYNKAKALLSFNDPKPKYEPLISDAKKEIDSVVEALRLKTFKSNNINDTQAKLILEKLYSNSTKTTIPSEPIVQYFHPSEMIDLGVFSDNNFYSNNPDNTQLIDGTDTKQWFDDYISKCDGFFTEKNTTPIWIETMRNLYADFDQIKDTKDEDKINARKQSILDLGWNPELEFDPDTRIKTTGRVDSIISGITANTHIVDCTIFDKVNEASMTQAQVRTDIKPIYIILTMGTTPFLSKAITKFTGSNYTHSALSITDLNKIYTYSYEIGAPHDKKGFVVEDLGVYGTDYIVVYTFFVKNKYAKKLEKEIKVYQDNQLRTNYSFKMLIDFVIKKIGDTSDKFRQVCSTFVNNVLTAAGIDFIPKEDIHLMTVPANFYKASNSNVYVYKVYEGRACDTNTNEIDSKVKLLMTSDVNVFKESYEYFDEESALLDLIDHKYDMAYLKTLSENLDMLSEENKVIVSDFISKYTTAQVCEAKEFPVQFDKDGNMIINKIKIGGIDYNQEFNESNRLIQLYSANKDYESMKYELSKLWYMYSSIESIVKKKTIKPEDKKSYMDSRARILNVFTKYMKEIGENDKSFNFMEYYNNTPFSDNSIRINASTMKYAGKLLKNLILGESVITVTADPKEVVDIIKELYRKKLYWYTNNKISNEKTLICKRTYEVDNVPSGYLQVFEQEFLDSDRSIKRMAFIEIAVLPKFAESNLLDFMLGQTLAYLGKNTRIDVLAWDPKQRDQISSLVLAKYGFKPTYPKFMNGFMIYAKGNDCTTVV